MIGEQGDLLALVVDTHRPDELEQPTLLDALEPEASSRARTDT